MMQTVLIQIQQKKTQQLPLIQTVQMLILLMMQQMLLKQMRRGAGCAANGSMRAGGKIARRLAALEAKP